ncbi:C2H2 transcription factor [Paraphaeosphaeria sporulosa]
MMTTRTASDTVEAHERPHKRQRTCQHCGQSFSKAEHLDRHVRSHTKEKPFVCALCTKSNRTSGSIDNTARASQDGEEIELSTASPTPMEGQVENSIVIPSFSSWANLDASAWNVGEGANTDPAIVPTYPTNTSPSDVDLFSLGVPYLEPSWQLGADFDVPALGSSLAATIFDWGWPPGIRPEHMQPTVLAGASELRGNSCLDDAPSATNIATKIYQNWYTNVTPDRTAPRTRRPSQQEAIDETYRESLTRRLHVQLTDSSLPSAEFLNLCIKMYFAKFHPIFPIIHAPSFQPSSENSLILLSVCSMGALFVGSSSAASQGRAIFQRLHKAVLASWETVIKRGHAEVLSLAQAAVIGQTFAMSSGHPTDVYLAESFHGTVIAWARRGGMFQIRQTLNHPEDMNASDVDGHWRAWARAEETVRIVIALHIHDAWCASIFHHEPLLRHEESKLPHCCSEETLSMPSAQRWFTFMKDAPRIGRPRFRAYATLARIMANIQELRVKQFESKQVSQFREQLISWIKEEAKETLLRTRDPFCLLVLWHECFMQVYANFDDLEQWIGRDGHTAVEEINESVHDWAKGREAKLCVLHALLIQKRLEALPAGAEPAIHVPRTLFYSALVIHTYIKAKPQSEMFAFSQADLRMPEIRLSYIDNNAQTNQSLMNSPVDHSMIFNAVDLLRRLGHLEIARKFASMLEPLLDGHIRA